VKAQSVIEVAQTAYRYGAKPAAALLILGSPFPWIVEQRAEDKYDFNKANQTQVEASGQQLDPFGQSIVNKTRADYESALRSAEIGTGVTVLALTSGALAGVYFRRREMHGSKANPNVVIEG
jgi:hypothetical protein